MPLEPALSFQNEADFTSRFLVPLVRRLGYSIVAEYHGAREFGKDLVFGEIDRFGEVAYHGLQSKYQDSISQADSEGLIEDCKQAFRHPFRHPTTGAEHRIASLVVANAGSIVTISSLRRPTPSMVGPSSCWTARLCSPWIGGRLSIEWSMWGRFWQD
jgi:hypothetical protein